MALTGGGIFESPRHDQVGRGSPRRLLGGINPALRGVVPAMSLTIALTSHKCWAEIWN
jgi:hypothetical protein